MTKQPPKKENKNWQFDLSICPDCNQKQKTEKQEDDNCDNKECDSFVTMYKGKLMWWNENWG